MQKRAIAAVELALLAPAAVFMAAVVIQNLGSATHRPARAAHELVMLYADRMWTLWILLMALPLLVLVTGVTAICMDRNGCAAPANGVRQTLAAIRADSAMRLVAGATAAAAVILVIVVLHMGAD